MSRTSIIAIFASAGLVFSGAVTADAVAFARAIQADDPAMLERFANQNPDSRFRDDALKLAARAGCTVNWVNGDCGDPFKVGGAKASSRRPIIYAN